jgi:hypothetical protein
VVRFAHPDCSPSAILTILRRPEPPEHRVHATCWLRPAGLAPEWASRAVVVISHDLRVWPRARASTATDLLTRALHSADFIHLTRPGQEPAHSPHLSIRLHKTDFTGNPLTENAPIRVVVNHPHGRLFDGGLDVPDPWRQEAQARRRVIVLTGTNLDDDLTALRNDDLQPDLTSGRIWAAIATLKAEELRPANHFRRTA